MANLKCALLARIRLLFLLQCAAHMAELVQPSSRYCDVSNEILGLFFKGSCIGG